ncbi:IgGFc-binding protein-like isoform X2 [Hyla sarda]|nr:IgGFc-binding protein-like isoform X2 [Hyla sarda]
MKNSNVNSSATLKLYLVTCEKVATVTVMVSQPFLHKTVLVDKDSSSLVTLDRTYMIGEEDVTSKVIMVTSDVAISVFAFNTLALTSDAMTCLPQEDLGTEYYIITPGGTTGKRGGQFAVANGFEPEVQVHITVSGSITYKGISYTTGDSFILTLGSQQVIQFQSPDDLTGTKISSSTPVAVFSGHSCFTGIGSTCDTIMEQLHPLQNWGKIFAVFPFFTHTQDVIDIVAGSPDTLVTVDSLGGTTQHSLLEGAHVRITVDKILTINATKPIMVSYLFQESRSSDIKYEYDPFITTVPPSLLGKTYYKFVTQSVYDNFIFIVSEASSDSEFYLDGKPLSSYPMTMKEFKGLRAWQVSVGKTDEQHEIYHKMSTFTLYVFGTEMSVSYGYSMGQGVSYPESCCLLRCLVDVAEYTLPYSLVSGAHLDVLDVHLNDPLCRPEKENDHYLIKIPFTKCGTNVLYEDGRTFYANTIYGTIPDTDVHRIEIPVRCEIESNRSLELTINPKVYSVVCKGSYNISMKLYQKDSFTDPVTRYPHEVDLHSSLHVELEIESEDEELQIFIETLTASPSLEDTNQKYTVIHHGCHQDSTLQVYPIPDQRRQRLSLHAFKFDTFHEVYLTAIVIICHKATSPNRCTQGCISPRRKRDILSSKEKLDTAKLSQGPIVFTSRERSKDNGFYIPPSISLSAICVIGLIAVMGLVIQTLYYKRKRNTLLKN